MELEIKSNAYSEALQYRQDLLPITTQFPTRCLENHINTCAENQKISGLKFRTLQWRHLAA